VNVDADGAEPAERDRRRVRWDVVAGGAVLSFGANVAVTILGAGTGLTCAGWLLIPYLGCAAIGSRGKQDFGKGLVLGSVLFFLWLVLCPRQW
jgi:hypothetical protein